MRFGNSWDYFGLKKCTSKESGGQSSLVEVEI
jgi:hypothetical protein